MKKMRQAPRRLTRTLAAVVTGFLAAGLAAVVPIEEAEAAPGASGCQVYGMYEVCTTDPDAYADGVDTTIVERIRDYVQATPDDGAITGAMYLWELDDDTPATERLVQDLIDAKERGVAVNLVLGNISGQRNHDTIARLRGGDVPVWECRDSCLPGASGGKSGAMHIKFFTFSGGNELRVLHTSSNFSQGQYKRHQNMLTVTGDEALYYNYVDYWNRLRKGSWEYKGDRWTGSERSRYGDVPGSKVYFFPRTRADPVHGTLEKLTCRAGHDRVWVAASLFVNRIAVLNVLDDLHRSGCDVRIVVARAQDRGWILAHSSLPSSRVLVLGNSSGNVRLAHHNKLVVTNAIYEGRERTAVYVGSHNLNKNSLRNSSDGMLRVTGSEVYERYADYFQHLHSLALPVPNVLFKSLAEDRRCMWSPAGNEVDVMPYGPCAGLAGAQHEWELEAWSESPDGRTLYQIRHPVDSPDSCLSVDNAENENLDTVPGQDTQLEYCEARDDALWWRHEVGDRNEAPRLYHLHNYLRDHRDLCLQADPEDARGGTQVQLARCSETPEGTRWEVPRL